MSGASITHSLGLHVCIEGAHEEADRLLPPFSASLPVIFGVMLGGRLTWLASP